MKTWLKVTFGVIIVSTLSVSIWMSCMQRAEMDKQWLRYKAVNRIGNALSRYSDDHGGKLPGELSKLIPDYISVAEILKYIGQVPKNGFEPSTFYGFEYFGDRGFRVNLVMCESTNLWNFGGRFNSVRKVVVLTSNFTASAFPESVVIGKILEINIGNMR